jgi:hypothetical protein
MGDAHYPDIKQDYNHVEACTMWFVKQPEYYDVIVTENLFGDIITDLAAIIQGGLGIAAGGNINPEGGPGNAPRFNSWLFLELKLSQTLGDKSTAVGGVQWKSFWESNVADRWSLPRWSSSWVRSRAALAWRSAGTAGLVVRPAALRTRVARAAVAALPGGSALAASRRMAVLGIRPSARSSGARKPRGAQCAAAVLG